MFTTAECAWSHVSIKILGATIVGLKGFSFKKSVEKEHVYAAGPKPIDIQTGNVKYEGSLKLLKYEVDRLNDAAQAAGYNDIIEVPHSLVLITCAYKKAPTDPIRIIEAAGVAFTEWENAMEQNAKFSEVNLPFLAMDIAQRTGK